MAVVFESSVGPSPDTVRPYPLATEGPSLLHCGARYALLVVGAGRSERGFIVVVACFGVGDVGVRIATTLLLYCSVSLAVPVSTRWRVLF